MYFVIWQRARNSTMNFIDGCLVEWLYMIGLMWMFI
jgi:hypothetical protein